MRAAVQDFQYGVSDQLGRRTLPECDIVYLPVTIEPKYEVSACAYCSTSAANELIYTWSCSCFQMLWQQVQVRAHFAVYLIQR